MINSKDEFDAMERELYPNKAEIRAKVNKLLDEFEGDDLSHMLMTIKETVDNVRERK